MKSATGLSARSALLLSIVLMQPALAGGDCGRQKQCNWKGQEQKNWPCDAAAREQCRNDWQKQCQSNWQKDCGPGRQKECNKDWTSECPINQKPCPENWAHKSNPSNSLIPENDNGVRNYGGGTTSLIEPEQGTGLMKSDGTSQQGCGGGIGNSQYLLNGDGTGTRPDGTVISKDFFDGSLIYSRPDGSSWQRKNDGSQIYKRPDGIQMIKNADGSGIVKDRNGQILMRK